MPQTLLLVQESPARAALVQKLLAQASGETFLVEWLKTGPAGIARLRDPTQTAVAAIAIDLTTADGPELEIFDRIFEAAPHVPILVLGIQEHEDAARKVVQRGAQDYILDTHLNSYSLSKALRNMIERAAIAEALFAEKEQAQITLNSIGDAVICTDAAGKVTYLNQVAAAMTGWAGAEALGRSFSDVFRCRDGMNSRYMADPMAAAIEQNRVVGLAAGCVLIRRDGVESPIEDSVAPIHDRSGRVTGAVMVFHDVTEAREMSKRMSHLANHDYLTDLPNRMLLNDRISQAIAVAQRQRQQFAVLFVDVDRFKHINDSLGHAIGDQLLVAVARRMVASVRGSDTVSRQGGDEFLILLPAVADANDAARSAHKIVTALSAPYHVKEHDLEITVSMGIGIYPGDGTDAETLVRNADVAMLHAKDKGRNNYQFFRAYMNEHSLERLSLESGLRHALDRREFALYYQPKMDLQTRIISGTEALIRWRQPGRGTVLPDQFIPIAEQCGYIVSIGRWVLREACRQTQLWLAAGLAATPVAVNVSPVELRSTGFVRGVREVLRETGLDPRYLEIELTETVLLQDHATTISVLHELKNMGVLLSLDDFGTGYSSLSYLKRFPIDALKIDKSFVHGLCKSASDANIVSAVISMGKSFGLKVIAEGVETREQLHALQARQCAEGQGFYFHKPVAATEFARILGSDISALAHA